MRSRPAALLSVPALIALCLASTACGGGGKSLGVPSLGSPAATTTAANRDDPAGGGSSAGGAGGGGVTKGFALKMSFGGNGDNGAKFSRCMRSHGVPNFPDPNAQG